MAASSITKSFVISGEEQVETFLRAIELSEQDPKTPPVTDFKLLTDWDEIRKLMEKMKKTNG